MKYLLISIIIIIFVWHKVHTDYSKPWWKGISSLSICELTNDQRSLGSCYTVPLESNGNEITQIDWPDGSSELSGNTTCNKTDKGNIVSAEWFCDFTDSQARQWEVSETLKQGI